MFKLTFSTIIGALATVGALGYGLWCFRKGKSHQSQIMMRFRIAAQGFTIVAILGGLFMSANPTTPKLPAAAK